MTFHSTLSLPRREHTCSGRSDSATAWIRSKTRLYQFFYDVLGPLMTLAVKAFPKYVTTTEQIGRAMIRVAQDGGEKRVLENEDIQKM